MKRTFTLLGFVNLLLTIIILFCLFLPVLDGCALIKKTTGAGEQKSYNEFKKQAPASLDEPPQQLIEDYQDMKQHELVSWVWQRPGFDLSRCRIVDVAPVKNFSAFVYPWAEERIGAALHKICSALKDESAGSAVVEVHAAIVDMKPQKKIVSRLLPFEEDFTSIEIHLVMVDKNSGETLCKLAHGKRCENFKEAIDGMMADIEKFFLMNLARKSS